MKNVMWNVCMVLVALSMVGCAFDFDGSCQSACQRAITNGCQAEGTDCPALCRSIRPSYDTAVAQSNTAGCRSQFDAVASCTFSGDPCAVGARCTVENDAYTTCFMQFCTANPTSSVCTSP